MEKKMVMIPVEDLFPHPDNPRKNIGDVQELSESIKANGILQNLTVVPSEQVFDDVNGKYVVIIGHRRLAAAKAAGVREVPCVISDMTPAEQFHTMMCENMQRADLTPIEQADGFQMMLDLGYSKEEISKETGFSRTTIDHRIKMAQLDREKLVKAEERGGTISDYIALEKIEDPEERNKVLEAIGTSDFNWKLTAAIRSQEAEKAVAAVEKVFSGHIKEMPKGENGWGPEWKCLGSIGSAEDAEKFLKKTEPGKDYYYKKIYGGISVYEKIPKVPKAAPPKKSEYEKNHDKWKAETDAQLKEIRKNLIFMRRAYFKGLYEAKIVKEKLYIPILTYAAKCFSIPAYDMYKITQYGDNRELFWETMGIEPPSEHYSSEGIARLEEVKAEMEKLPMKELAVMIWQRLETQAKFYTWEYGTLTESEEGTEKILMDYLRDMKYEFCHVEQDIIDGTFLDQFLEDEPKKEGK